MEIGLIAVLINLVCLGLLVGFTFYTIVMPFFSAPFYASSTVAMLKMFELADLGPEDNVVDLGSGDGRFVLAASRIAKSATGIEHNPYLTVYSRFLAIISSNGIVKFKNKNMFKENFGEYNVVFCYLFPEYMEKLKKKFETELKPGSKIITNTFKLKGWRIHKSLDNRYHLYIIGDHLADEQ